MNPRPGEVWLADLGLAAKTRPVLIVSRYEDDPPRSLAVYVPLTTQDRPSHYEVHIPHLHARAIIHAGRLGSLGATG